MQNQDKEQGTHGDSAAGTTTTDNDDDKLRRHFKQRKVTSTRSDASSELKQNSTPNDRLTNVLSKVL